MVSGQTVVSRLHALIVENDLKEIKVYRFDNNKPHHRKGKQQQDAVGDQVTKFQLTDYPDRVM